MVACSFNSINDFHPAVIAAVRENAERQACMVAELLHALDPRLKEAGLSSGAAGLPAGFLLELGAICQLVIWENEGLRSVLAADVPSADEAILELNREAAEAPDQFQSPMNRRLGARVMQVWLERFSWAAPDLLQADVVVGEVDEDALVEALAQLLMDHRHDFPGQGQ
jgi:hypothetical protein